MRMDKRLERNIRLIALLLLVVLGMSYIGYLPFSIVPSNYEGPRPLFYAVTYQGRLYTNTQRYNASACTLDTTMLFDPDGTYSGLGNLAGEETSIFIPRSDTILNLPSWVPSDWRNSLQQYVAYGRNPIETYNWTVRLDNGTVIAYSMQEWLLKWFVSISYDWNSGDEAGLCFGCGDVRYPDTLVWFKIMLNPMWYYGNATQSYFGIAKITVDNVKLEAKDKQGNTIQDTNLRVIPMSSGSILPLYDKPLGSSLGDLESQVYSYQGRVLNPQVFKPVVYTKIDLENFGSKVTGHYITGKDAYGDVVTYSFNVYVFSVGVWKVKDIQQVPSDYGRTPQTGHSGFPHLSWTAKFGLAGLGALVGLALLMIFYPEAIFSLIAVLSWVRRR